MLKEWGRSSSTCPFEVEPRGIHFGNTPPFKDYIIEHANILYLFLFFPLGIVG